MAGFDNDVLVADNWDFRGSIPVVAQATSAGIIPIATGGTPAIKAGQLTSSNSTVTISYSDPDINVVAGSAIATSYLADTGTAIPNDNKLTIEGDSNIQTTGSGSILTITSAGSIQSKTSNYTAQPEDYFINCTANSFTVTLPAASGLSNKQYQIKNTGSGTITLDGNGTETIDGDLTQTLAQDESMTLICDGSSWFIV